MLRSGVIAFLMLAALPVLIVLSNTLERRYPGGFAARYPWLLHAILAVVYVVAAVEAYSRSARVRGGIFMAAGIATIWLVLAEFGFRRNEKPGPKGL